ncbi:hypothetical protein COP1_028182 [Malus domestica]
MEALQGGQMGLVLQQAKAPLIVPLLKLLVVLCLGMSVMLFVEKVYMGIVITLIKLFRRKPEKKWKWEAVKDDVELGNSAYPVVLVQIPMFISYQLELHVGFPDRVIIQVLDDSTDPAIKDLVELEVKRWASKGINIKYEIRDNRKDYKAGALKEGMKHSYVKQCDFVAIFDADFQPDPDFLCAPFHFLSTTLMLLLSKPVGNS